MGFPPIGIHRALVLLDRLVHQWCTSALVHTHESGPADYRFGQAGRQILDREAIGQGFLSVDGTPVARPRHPKGRLP
jgi:hypothetical protein